MLVALSWLGRHGQLCLIAGLAGGLLLPELAAVLRPWIGTLIAILLFVTAIRVGAKRAIGQFNDLSATVLRIAALQIALPLTALAVFSTFGLLGTPLALAVTMMLSAPSLTGAPNFAIMAGHDPAPGMRLLVLSTLLFPITAIPVLALLDPIGQGALGALALSFGLLMTIMFAVSVGFVVRKALPWLGGASAQSALDGCAALLLAIVVVGLMSAIGPLFRADIPVLLMWIATAICINFGLVIVTLLVSRRAHLKMPISTAIYAGNRNIALFLIVLPDTVAAPLMIFVGCYQIPMYLTPLLLKRLESILPTRAN